MKATIEFDLNEHDDRMAHLRATKSLDLALALWEIIFNTKRKFEHQIENNTFNDQHELLDSIYEQMHSILEENDININRLVD